MVYKSILDTIGNTPLVKINNFKVPSNIKVFAKIEGSNPGGSIKDRVALQMIEDAEKKGTLTKEKVIIEPTSGNTGIGIAMIAAVKGYKTQIVMSEAVSIERRKVLESFGAKIILTDGTKGTDGAIIKAHEIVDSNPDKYFMPDQFSNLNNPLAHYLTTGPEIWSQMDGEINYFVASLGTTGTLMGISKYLKEKDPTIKIIGAEAELNHKIQGLKNMKEAIVPQIYNSSMIDEIISIGTEEALDTARDIIKKEGIFVGMSSGSSMRAVLKLVEKIGNTKANIVTIFPDRGEKYLSTNLFA